MPTTPDIDFTLRRVFKKKKFRPLQREIITAALNGHDVFVQAATSFGKSLCYQLPAMLDHGITLCISPLLSLMANQVDALAAATATGTTGTGSVAVASINSRTPQHERDAVLADLRCGHPRTRLLYVTPEYCQTETFRRLLRLVYDQRELARVAVDEAHCISEWGHDFRAAYRHLDYFRQTFPQTPIMCLTATATARVRDDVIGVLGLRRKEDDDGDDGNDSGRSLKIFSTSTFRPNLHYEIRFYSEEDDDRLERLVAWIKGVHGRRRDDAERCTELEGRGQRAEGVSGIVYATTRAECEAVAARLRERGVGAQPYHAGLAPGARVQCQTRWVEGTPGHEVVVATTAFGMGIDKEDVRFVVHWSLPKSFEGFYQEAGRAGRDGRASLCALYYSREDRDRMLWRLSRDLGGLLPPPPRAAAEGLGGGGGVGARGGRGGGGGKMASAEGRTHSLRKLIEYCESTEVCRHKLISAYFGEHEQQLGGGGGGGGNNQGVTLPQCDFACDHCKDKKALKERKRKRLATEEWVSTQRETGALYDEYDCYD